MIWETGSVLRTTEGQEWTLEGHQLKFATKEVASAITTERVLLDWCEPTVVGQCPSDYPRFLCGAIVSNTVLKAKRTR